MRKKLIIIGNILLFAISLMPIYYLLPSKDFNPHKDNRQIESKVRAHEKKKEKPQTSSPYSFDKGRIQHQSNIPSNEKIAYLTFDDGPSLNTPKILDILKANNVKASFFVIGNETPFGLKMYKRIVDEGHTIGNHTYSHQYSQIYKNIPQFFNDFNREEELIYQTTGVKAVMVRLPGGSNNHVSYQYGGRDLMPKVTKELSNEKYKFTDWNVDSSDADRAVQNVKVIINRVLSTTYGQKNIIVLMHDAPEKRTTPEALPRIIQGLKQQGYHFYPLSPNSETVQFIH